MGVDKQRCPPARPLLLRRESTEVNLVDCTGRQSVEILELAADDAKVTFEDVSANTPDEGFGDVEALARAVRALPAGQRQAIELLKLKEMSG